MSRNSDMTLLQKLCNNDYLMLKFNCKKVIIGSVLALLALLICFFGCSHALAKPAGLCFAAAFFIVSCITFDTRKRKITVLLNILWGIGCLIAAYILIPLMFDFPSMFSMEPLPFWLNTLCILVICCLFFLITANWKATVTISILFLMAVATINGFTFAFRGKEIGPMDLLSLGTAMTVADQYQFTLSPVLIFCWIACSLTLFCQFSIPSLPKFSRIRSRVIALAAAALALVVVHFGSAGISIRTWDKEASGVNGFYLNFYIGVRNSIIAQPENYSPELLDEYAHQYAVTADDTPSKPNIIVVMNEAYADLRVFGQELNTNIPVTPYYDSLKENTVRGYALSSVFGGNTVNSEFEFLTGHSLAFLPDNVVPYQQYISEEIFSFAHLMNSMGYQTLGTHPFLASGYSRSTVYPLLGFQKSTFQESYPLQSWVRNFTSDRETYEYFLNCLDQKEDGSPLFLYGITIQNHGGYTYEGGNYTKTVSLEGYSRAYPQAEQYLSLLNNGDAALEFFLTALEEYPEDTIVLFYGDHLPKIELEFYEELNGSPLDTLDEQMLQYSVPFFIWANFDIEAADLGSTSLNYLAGHLLEYAGLELPVYYQMLADIETVIPAVNAHGYYSLSQGCYIPLSEAAGEEAEALNLYEMLQYNDLFDSKHRSELLFGQYLP